MSTNLDGEPSPPGLQVERTMLAWLRTTLTFMVGSAVMTRLLAFQNMPLAIANATLTLPLGVAVTWLAWRRYVRSKKSFDERTPLPDAVLPCLITILAMSVGCFGLLYVLTI